MGRQETRTSGDYAAVDHVDVLLAQDRDFRVLVAIGEFAQRLLATRVPDTTDAVLVLFGAPLVHTGNRADGLEHPG
jgi:hypothetical protein